MSTTKEKQKTEKQKNNGISIAAESQTVVDVIFSMSQVSKCMFMVGMK